MKRTSIAFTMLAVCLPAGVALGQPVTVEESVVEGPGHLVGEGTVIHPHLSLETGVVNNLFYEENNPVTTPVARLIGGVSIASQNAKPAGELEAGVVTESDDAPAPPASQVDFRVGAQLIFMGYPSGNSRARDQTDLAGGLDGEVVVNPAGDFVFAAADQFLRDAQPRNFESFGSLNRDYNHAVLGLTFRPGEHAFGVGLRYENTIDRFESSDSSFADRIQHVVAARADWRYLPITRFYLDASYGFYGALGDSMGFKSGSNPLRIQLGVGTALTWATSLIAHIGYANGFYDSGESYNMAIGGLEFGYRYSEYGRVKILADYDYHDSLQANYYRDITLGASVDQQIGLIMLGADAAFKLRSYRGTPAVIGPPDRDDVLFGANIKFAYLLRDTFAITARLRAMIDETDYMYNAGAREDSPKYQRFEGVVGATVAF